MTQHAFGCRRTWYMNSRQVTRMTTQTARGYTGVIKSRADERRRTMTIATILAGGDRGMIRRFSNRTERTEHTAVTRIATHARHIIMIEQSRLRPRLRRYAMT